MVDLTGRRIGRLVVLRLIERKPRGRSIWECRCDCGTIKVAAHSNLLHGHTRSCGCLRAEVSRKNLMETNAPEHVEWRALLDTLLEVVTRFPQRPGEIFEALRDTWGTCDERRLWRALRALVERGLVERRGRKQSSADDDPSVYLLPRRSHEDVQDRNRHNRSGNSRAVGRGEAGHRVAG
jgi:hypothetical protein